MHLGPSFPTPSLESLRDVLVWQEQDVRGWPWRERRRLESLQLPDGGVLRRERIAGAESHWWCRQVRALGREAIHAHRRDAPYVAGPSITWLSIAVDAPARDLAA